MRWLRQAMLSLALLFGIADSFAQSGGNQNKVGRNQFCLFAETTSSKDVDNKDLLLKSSSSASFDTDTALFCAGLAFDAYVEPPEDSSRWERGVSNSLEGAKCRLHFLLHSQKKLSDSFSYFDCSHPHLSLLLRNDSSVERHERRIQLIFFYQEPVPRISGSNSDQMFRIARRR